VSESATKHQMIRNYILNLIETGKYKYNDRLPSRNTFASNFKCAPATIVKVFDELATEGILYKKNGSGTYIAEPKAKKHLSIAVLMSKVYFSDDQLLGTYNFKPQILQYTEMAASEIKAEISLFLDLLNPEVQKRKLIHITESEYDGVIYIDELDGVNKKEFTNLKKKGITTVQIDRIIFPDMIDSVLSDNLSAISDTIDILLKNSFDDIHFITYSREHSSVTERKEAYVNYYKKLGFKPKIYNIDIDEKRIILKSSINDLNKLAKSLNSNSCVFCTDAYQLNSIYEALKSYKLNIDLSQIALASFDGLPVNIKDKTNTIIIHQDLKSICDEAIRIIADKSKNKKNYVSNIKIPCQIEAKFE